MQKIIFIYIMLIFSILIVTQISSAQLISYPASCYGDTETTNFEAFKACDRDSSTFWESGVGGFPHWLIVNFTSNYTFDGFSIFSNGPTHIDFQIPNGIGGWNTVQGFDTSCSGSNVIYTNFNLTTPSNLTNQIRLYATTGCVTFWDLRETLFSFAPIQSTPFQVPATISVIGWLLGLIALALFIFGAWKFPLSIFVSGIVTIFLGLQLFSETHSIIISSFVWLLGIFVILFGIWRVKGDLD